jgi:hypothetical protein
MLFDVQNVYPAICTNCGVQLTADASLDVQSGGSSIVGQSAVAYGTIPTYLWTLTNIPSATCSVSKTSSGGTNFNTISGITSSGSTTGNSLTNASYTFAINCTNPTISKSVSFTVAAQPPGFSLGQDDTIRIQFLQSGSAESEQKSIFVNPVGSFSNPVTVSISGFPTPPSGTTFLYSLGGSAYSSNPAPVIISSPYSAGTTLRIQSSKPITNTYTVTLTGSASGYASATKNLIITPVNTTPAFQEI